MTISQLEEAGIRKVATKVTTTLNCLEGAVQGTATWVTLLRWCDVTWMSRYSHNRKRDRDPIDRWHCTRTTTNTCKLLVCIPRRIKYILLSTVGWPSVSTRSSRYFVKWNLTAYIKTRHILVNRKIIWIWVLEFHWHVPGPLGLVKYHCILTETAFLIFVFSNITIGNHPELRYFIG